MQLAGVPVREDDVSELADLLRAGEFDEVAHKLDHEVPLEPAQRDAPTSATRARP
jgi:hypothetical protein